MCFPVPRCQTSSPLRTCPPWTLSSPMASMLSGKDLILCSPTGEWKECHHCVDMLHDIRTNLLSLSSGMQENMSLMSKHSAPVQAAVYLGGL